MLPEYAKDNIDRLPYEYYLEKYQKADPTEICGRLAIPYDFEKKQFTITFLGVNYHITYPDFQITHEGAQAGYFPLEENVHAKILVLRYLENASVFPHNGDFRAYRELLSGELYVRQFQGRCLFRLNRKYGKKPELLRRIMKELGAVSVKHADHGYELELFENLYIRFLFWEGDEEFPPSSQILFSSNFPAAFGTYDLAEIGEICIHTFGAVERLLQDESC